MRILWIPHNTWGLGRYQRDQYLIDQLSREHQIHVAEWSSFKPHTLANLTNFRTYANALRFSQREINGRSVYHIPRVPGFFSRFSRSKLAPDLLNYYLLVNSVRAIVQRESIDVVVTAQAIDRRKLKVPVVLDYVDWAGQYSRRDRSALKYFDAILCVSELLKSEAEVYNPNCLLIPNGVDLKLFSQANGEEVRKSMGLVDALVVSLIGLTSSPDLYFIPAVLKAKKRLPKLKCLLVGESMEIASKLRDHDPDGKTFRYVGPVAYSEAPRFFAASDVGLYPSNDSKYFQAASPIKVFEYTAAGKAVVLSRLQSLQALGWKNLIFRRPEVEDYAEGICEAATLGPRITRPPDLNRFDWEELGNRVAQVLWTTVKAKG